MNLNLVLVISFGLLNSQVFGKPGLSPPDAIDEFTTHQAMQSCGDLDDTCAGCLTLENCKFASFSNSETKCVDVKLTEEEIGNMKANATLEDVALSEDKCSQTGNGDDKPGTQIPPKFSTSLTPENETTTSATPSTPSTSATSTSTTATSNSTSTSTSTTTESTTPSTPSTTSSAKPTTPTSTSTSTTTEKSSTVTATASPIISTTPVDPSGKNGSKFDGWSFFGGILLTIGLSAIGFVSFKYYKVRSGGNHAGTNYNRF